MSIFLTRQPKIYMKNSWSECLNSWKSFTQFSHLSDTRNSTQFFWQRQMKPFLNFGIYYFLNINIELSELSVHHCMSGSSAVRSTTQRQKNLRKQTLSALVLTDNLIFILFHSDIYIYMYIHIWYIHIWIYICKVSEGHSNPNRYNTILSQKEPLIFKFQLDLSRFQLIINILLQNRVSSFRAIDISGKNHSNLLKSEADDFWWAHFDKNLSCSFMFWLYVLRKQENKTVTWCF